jgi:lipopolysaccharide transport system permease protein
VDPLLRLAIQIWFYASPIIYPASGVPEKWRAVYFLNPLAGIIEGYRDVLIHGRPPGAYLISSAIVASLIFALGFWYFKRVEYQFADII